MNLSSLKFDPAKQADGVWFDFGTDVRFKIARLGNPAYQRRLKEEANKNRVVIAVMKDDAAAEAMMRKVYAETILLDWAGVQLVEDGPFEPYTSQLAEKVLTEVEVIWDFVRQCAENSAAFMQAAKEADVENLSGS